LTLLLLIPGLTWAFHTVTFDNPLRLGEELEVLIEGFFPDTCWFVESVWTSTDLTENLLTLEFQEGYSGGMCLTIITDFALSATFSDLPRGSFTLRVIQHPYDPTGMGLSDPQVEEFTVKVLQAVADDDDSWGGIKARYR
jgi:hypothetical protein